MRIDSDVSVNKVTLPCIPPVKDEFSDCSKLPELSEALPLDGGGFWVGVITLPGPSRQGRGFCVVYLQVPCLSPKLTQFDCFDKRRPKILYFPIFDLI